MKERFLSEGLLQLEKRYFIKNIPIIAGCYYNFSYIVRYGLSPLITVHVNLDDITVLEIVFESVQQKHLDKTIFHQ